MRGCVPTAVYPDTTGCVPATQEKEKLLLGHGHSR